MERIEMNFYECDGYQFYIDEKGNNVLWTVEYSQKELLKFIFNDPYVKENYSHYELRADYQNGSCGYYIDFWKEPQSFTKPITTKKAMIEDCREKYSRVKYEKYMYQY